MIRMGTKPALVCACGHDGFFAGAEVGNRGLIKKTEDDGETLRSQILRDCGVADDGGGSFEAALPAWLGGVADEEALRGEADGDKHGLRDALEVAQREAMPTRSVECSGM